MKPSAESIVRNPSLPDEPAAAPRVAIVYRMDNMGGVQSCVLALARGLNRRGIVPDILWDVEPNWKLLEKAGVQANYRHVDFVVGSRTIDRLPETLRYLARAFNVVDGGALQNEYDFFYVFYNGFLLPEGAPHLRYLSGPPLLPQLDQPPAGLAGLPSRALHGIYRKFMRRSKPVYEYHRESPYVINSSYTAGLFEEAHGVRLPVVYPPIPVQRREFEPGDWEKRDTMIFFSRILPYKRPELVLELAEYNPGLRTVIMGGVAPARRKYYKSLQEMAIRLGRPDVIFHANASNETVAAELARARYYVFPARNEHFGMTTVEAMTSGALPFVHDSGGQREIVPDERLRFSDEDVMQKFKALRALPDAEVHSLRQRLMDHIQQYSEERYTERMLRDLDCALEK